MNLYITQDRIGTPTGGGAVTYHEYDALLGLGVETHPIDAGRVQVNGDPFQSDQAYNAFLKGVQGVGLAALYSGCLTETVRTLRASGVKVSYTAAAHSIKESRQEFEGLGAPFPYPHLTQPELWDKYVDGYRQADLVICPSKLSKACMESYGCKNVKVIPHGTEIPATVAPFPKRFTLGYLGQAGPDKGLRYLFEAWKKLNLKDATLLIAGNNIDQALPLWRRFGGGNVEFMGFVKHVSEFYNRISLYVQPSVTEGFGIEVLEAQAYGRPVICSAGAGACDLVSVEHCFAPRSVDQMIALIEGFFTAKANARFEGEINREGSKMYSWEKIKGDYQHAWRALMAGTAQ